jgi:cytochrome c peroxidase
VTSPTSYDRGVNHSTRRRFIVGAFAALASLAVSCRHAPPPPPEGSCDLSAVAPLDDLQDRPLLDSTGAAATRSSLGRVDTTGDFFRALGTNGRRCVSCHVPSQGWTVTPGYLQRVFDATNGGVCDDGRGLSAVFRLVDGAVSPVAEVGTLDQRRDAYRLLLSRGVVRIELPVPPGAEFEIAAIDDPYHYARFDRLSLFRRPPPTTNLKFDSAVMWDGRETPAGVSVVDGLAAQANTAVVTHAQGAALSEATRRAIVTFETSLATAQVVDQFAGALDDGGARGGPAQILAQPFHIGINDPLGDRVSGAPFDPAVFTIYDAWVSTPIVGAQGEARRSIERGQRIFDRRPIAIRGVGGINDEPVFGSPAELAGTCTTCHDTPGAGNHSVAMPLDIGIADVGRRTPEVPLYTLRNKATGETVQVTDPGRALIDGRWAHVGRFRGPVLRGLAARAPYFHDGSAVDLDAVVDFYDGRFQLDLTPAEHRDLVMFLRSL